MLTHIYQQVRISIQNSPYSMIAPIGSHSKKLALIPPARWFLSKTEACGRRGLPHPFTIPNHFLFHSIRISTQIIGLNKAGIFFNTGKVAWFNLYNENISYSHFASMHPWKYAILYGITFHIYGIF